MGPGGILCEDFDAVIAIPLRSVQQQSLEEVMIEHIGREDYQNLINSIGSRCLIILEGLDEMAVDRQQSDRLFVCLVKENTLLEDAIFLITSRPSACKELNAGRSIEILGFGKEEIKRFVKESFPNDEISVDEFMKELDKYPQLYSFYVPMNLVMIVEIFHQHDSKLPSTLTDLYCQFIGMILKKYTLPSKTKSETGLSAVTVDKRTMEILSEMLPCISESSKETIGTSLFLSRLAYYGCCECSDGRGSGPR